MLAGPLGYPTLGGALTVKSGGMGALPCGYTGTALHGPRLLHRFENANSICRA